MKRLFNTLLLTLLAMCVPAIASDYKVIDRSAKKAPEWLKSPDLTGSIVVDIERPNLTEAQAAAEDELKLRIVGAIATNISQTSQTRIESTSDAEIEEYRSRISSATARLPFLNGISLSKAQTYWEKRRDKKSGREYVVLTAQFPMPQSTLDKWIEEFNRMDAEKYAELQSLRSGLATVDSSDEIQNAINNLEALQAYFFDPVRLAEAKAVCESYQQLYKGLSLDASFAGKNECRVEIKLNGKPFKVTGRPVVKSNCASRINVTQSSDGLTFIIKYSTEDCLDIEDNYLDFDLRIRSARLHQQFSIPK